MARMPIRPKIASLLDASKLTRKILLCISLISIGILLLFYPLSYKLLKWRLMFLFFFGLGLSLIVFRYFELRGEKEELKDTLHEILFSFNHAKSAWCYGAGFTCIFISIIILSPEPKESMYETIFTIALGIFGLTLGMHFLYRNFAPIININLLLDLIVSDLKKIKDQKKKANIWFIYPALNMGFYRALDYGEAPMIGGKLNPDHRLGKVNTLLLEILCNRDNVLNPMAIAITYPRDLYHKLFKSYHKMKKDLTVSLKNDDDDSVINDCVASAKQLTQSFDRGMELIRFIEIMPNDNFPENLIILGDVVYNILTYGLPVYKNGENADFDVLEDPELAYLIVWRREDPELVKVITNHLREFLKTRGIEIPRMT